MYMGSSTLLTNLFGGYPVLMLNLSNRTVSFKSLCL